jgi:ABC-type spermidine/putrescine transport system permease subunit II
MRNSVPKVDKNLGWGIGPAIVVAALTLLILLPLCLVFLYAFATKWFAAHWWWPQELGTKWILSIFETDNLINALVNSYFLATLTTIATLLITFPAAYVLGTRARAATGWPATFVENLSNLPLAFPTITVALGLLPLYAALGLMATVTGIVLCHMIMAVPYALRSMVGSFLMVKPEYEEAARNLGASKFFVMRKIYLPLVWRGVLAAGIFAFSWSLNEFVLVLLLGFPDIETIPVQIYQFVGGYYLHPQKAAALGLFLLIPALGLMYIVERLLKGAGVVPAGA